MNANFGNWVPTRLLILLWSGTGLSALFLGIFLQKSTVLSVIFGILTLLLLLYSVLMQCLHHGFSFDGSGVMGRTHRFLLQKLPWDGRGTLLDVGCGSGALTIRAARKFPDSFCMGVDPWGISFDYNRTQCEHNAEAMKVSNVEFRKGDARKLPYASESFDAAVSSFVYHEIRTEPDKYRLLQETFRVLKKGGSFALLDLFGSRRIYGDMDRLLEQLKKDGISDIHYERNLENLPIIPGWLRNPMMLRHVGILYGTK